MRQPYINSIVSQRHLEDYYRQQLGGGGYPIFIGGRGQRGKGLGNLFGSLFRNILPFLKSGLKAVGKQALRTGLDVATDVIKGGQNLRESVQNRVPEGIKNFAVEKGFIPREVGKQEGSGNRKRKRHNYSHRKKSKKSKINKHKKRKIHYDIFL